MEDKRFSGSLAHALLLPSSNPLDSISKGLLDFGKVIDTASEKRKNNSLFNYDFNRKKVEDSHVDDDFRVKHERIKEKVSDNSKLAKLMSSGDDFNTFTGKYGDFKTPSVVKIAKDFTNKNKSLLGEAERKKQWAMLSSDPRFLVNGTFDYGKATEHLSGKVRRGEVEPVLGAKLMDGLHKVGGYGIYSAQKDTQRKPNILLDKGKASLLKRALSIQDPTLQTKAIRNIDDVDSMEKLAILGGVIQQYDTSSAISIDKKKASQKYAVQVGNFLSTSGRLENMISNYDPKFTGMLDTAYENTLQNTNLANPDYTAYKKNMGNIFLDFKELNNMGASFTVSEQKMMKNAMPNLNSSDDEYKRDMIDFTKLIRDKVKSKIIALDSANYNTGELGKVIDYYDSLVEKVESKFGKQKKKGVRRLL